MTLNSIIVWVIVGGVAGTIADWLVSGVRMGCLGTVIVGIIGAFVGAWLLSALNVSIGGGIINDIITASIGAVALLLGVRLLRRI
ncbi:MAG: GlsB/YeaQ/YmgE family stress response membrane protein [Anaerolineales bacterium]|nr:GlsB/YeaQ/YmgE family stress response membrane protein [Anaerolineae bacterium]PWB72579.1 MAG: GlsB/YeaQ/YmgE family stress response membrane protein [Anaerolineales bacterium]